MSEKVVKIRDQTVQEHAALTPSLSFEDDAVLFPIRGTKERKRKYYLKQGEETVNICEPPEE